MQPSEVLCPFIHYQPERSFLMRIKLDRYDLTVLINGLNTMREQYSQRTNDYLCDLILQLIEIHDNTKPRRKTRISFNSNEFRVIRMVLIDWRNQFINSGHTGAAEGIGELLAKIM